MKKILAIMGILTAVTVTSVHADPGPYDPFLNSDSCDTTADGIATACMNVANTSVVDVVNYLLTNISVVSPFATNEDLDAIQMTTVHSYWGNAAGPGTLAYISISASGFNTPGIYEQGNLANQVLMSGHTGDMIFGDGSQADPYPGLLNLFMVL